MAESQVSALNAQVIEAKIAFKHSEEAFNVATLAFVSASLSDPVQSGEKLLACFAGVEHDFGSSPQHERDKGQNRAGKVSSIGANDLNRQAKESLRQCH